MNYNCDFSLLLFCDYSITYTLHKEGTFESEIVRDKFQYDFCMNNLLRY